MNQTTDTSFLFSYVLFSIGNVKPLFQNTAAFHDCWKTGKTCNKQWVNAVDYLEIVGIVLGQILVGVLGDWYVHTSTERKTNLPRSLTIFVGLVVGGVSFKMPPS